MYVYHVIRRTWLDAPPVATVPTTPNAERECWHYQRPCGKISGIQHAMLASYVGVDDFIS